VGGVFKTVGRKKLNDVSNSDKSHTRGAEITRLEEEISCPVCGSREVIHDSNTGEVICASCGYVISTGMLDSSKDWRAFDSDEYIQRAHTGAPVTPTRPSYGLDTDITLTRTSLSRKTLQSLRRTHRHVSDPREKTIEPALRRISSAAQSLNLPPETEEDAAMLYRMAARAGLVKGRSMDAMVAAVIYAACRRTEVPRTLEEVASLFNLKEKDVGRSFRFLFRKLGIRIPPPKPENFVPAICAKLGLPDEIVAHAIKILKMARERGATMGREPVGVAAAAIYMACQEFGEHRTQREMAQAAGVTEVTVRNRYKELVKKVREEWLKSLKEEERSRILARE